MKRITLMLLTILTVMPGLNARDSAMRGLFGGAATGALVGGLAGGGRGAGYGALAGGVLGTAIGASEDARRRRYVRYSDEYDDYGPDVYYDNDEYDENGYYNEPVAPSRKRRRGGYARRNGARSVRRRR